jgi:hypothetical protein
MRASDADRDAAADRLRDAHAEGRLTLEEVNERLERTFTAKTHGELAGVTADLPAVASTVAAPAPANAPPPRTPYAGRGHVRRMWAAWATAVFVNVAIWGAVSLSAGDGVYFWPIWVAGPWGALLLAQTLFGAERERAGRQDGERDHL